MVNWNFGSAASSSSPSPPAVAPPQSSSSGPASAYIDAASTPTAAPSADRCPVDHETRSAWLAANPGASHPFHSSASPSASASSSSSSTPPSRLSQNRVISSIPRSSTSFPSPEGSLPSAHETGQSQDGDGKWVYPSEQQFFNAMLRKNHNPQAKDMRTIVPIHNAVNEKAWEEVLAWEGARGSQCGGPRLISFVGRPKDRTPKAWLKSLCGYTPPFDRHDWLIDRCGTQIRYVIDFYAGKSDPSNPRNMAFYLDVRPALDSVEGVRTRFGSWVGL